MQGYEAGLQDVETWLGDDHNLVILPDPLIREPDLFENEKFIELVVNLIEKRQKELRANAESLGERIYQEKRGIWRGACGGSGQGGTPNQEPREI
jgi:hypothetical protein